MVSPGSLVLYRNQVARISSVTDGKYMLESPGTEPRKVREKDFFLIHPGPVKFIPLPRSGGDFETAHAMVIPGEAGEKRPTLSWKDFAELVFGEFSPETAIACVYAALEGTCFRIDDGEPSALRESEIALAKKKAEEKAMESQRRTAFAKAIREASGGSPAPAPALRSADFAKYLADMESFALGNSERCPTAQDAGIAETREAVHKALVDAGIWEPCFNPWPQRSGCSVKPNRLPFPETELEFPGGRKNLEHLASFAIDNAWSHDPDDAIAIDDSTIWIHIADPAAFIQPGSDIDSEALSRGATLYLPERTIPMLPAEAVARLGLGLGEVSPALSFAVTLGPEGAIESLAITPSTIRVQRLTYEGADSLLDRGHQDLSALRSLAELRKRRREDNGAVDINLPEVSIKATEPEVVFNIIQPSVSADIVKEMMLLAGEALARWAVEKRLPFPFSCQEAPQIPRELRSSREGAAALSVQYLRRKGMRGSITGPEPLAHQGLGLSFYSQVTSPLRRYQDLLCHYQIRAMLARELQIAGQEKTLSRILDADEIGRRCLLSGQASAMNRTAERESRYHWTICHLAGNPEWTGKAIVLEARERELWVIIPALGLETSVRTRSRIEPDTEITVRCTRADITMHEITFDLA